MSKWMVSAKKADFDGIAARFGIRNITSRLIANRLITSNELAPQQCNDRTIGAYLNGDLSMMGDPHGLADIEKGAAVMLDRIRSGAKIRVIGDYDVDGICSSYILVSGLRLFGGNVDCVLPDRIKDGYGLSVKLVDQALEDGIDTIITCDNGIAAYEQIRHAKAKGMTVVVTDHHEIPFEDGSDGAKKEILPPADAVIDPKRAEGSCSFKEICGAVVAYKFLQVMAEASGKASDAEEPDCFGKRDLADHDSTCKKDTGMNEEPWKPETGELQDFFTQMLIFAGIATVCDVMELRDENRIIVRKSLELMPQCTNKGLRALINVTGLDAGNMNCYHYGFVIGPCLNATGRLDLAGRALSLFFTEDESEAALIAGDLKDLNDSRKDMTRQGVDKASEFVEKSCRDGKLHKVLVIYLPDVHESIAGIIAGRIKERYYRPTIVLTDAAEGTGDATCAATEDVTDVTGCVDAEKGTGDAMHTAQEDTAEDTESAAVEGTGNESCAATEDAASDSRATGPRKMLKGSGRSIEGYDMFLELSSCKDLFTKFGGHKMAAGLSLPLANLEELRRRLNESCSLTDEDFEPVLHLDMQLPFKAIDMDLVREFSRLEPFGNGNGKPVFAQREVALLSGRILGKNQNVGKYRITDESGIIYDMMYFGDMSGWHGFLNERFGSARVKELYDGRSDGSMRIKIAYYPDINSYQGRESLQLVMSDFS